LAYCDEDMATCDGRVMRHVLLGFEQFGDSQTLANLVGNDMNNSPPDLTDLPSEVQAFIAAQSASFAAKDADMMGLKQDMLGLNLAHAADQNRLKSKAETAQAALLVERTAHAQTIQNRDVIIADLRMQLDGHKNTGLAHAQKVAPNWRWS
jgi:transposase